MLLAVSATRACCLLLSSLLTTRPPGTSPQSCSPSTQVPACSVARVSSFRSTRPNICLLCFIKVFLVTSSSLPGYLWMADLSFSVVSGPYNIVSSSNLVRLPSITSSKSLLKMLKSSGPIRDPSITSLVISLKAKPDPLTAIFWTWIFYCYFQPSSFPPIWLSLGDNLQIFIIKNYYRETSKLCKH